MRVGAPTVGSQVPRYPPSGTETSTSTGVPRPDAAIRDPTCWKGTPSALRSAAPQTSPSYRSSVAKRTTWPWGRPRTRSTTSSYRSASFGSVYCR